MKSIVLQVYDPSDCFWHKFPQFPVSGVNFELGLHSVFLFESIYDNHKSGQSDVSGGQTNDELN